MLTALGQAAAVFFSIAAFCGLWVLNTHGIRRRQRMRGDRLTNTSPYQRGDYFQRVRQHQALRQEPYMRLIGIVAFAVGVVVLISYLLAS